MALLTATCAYKKKNGQLALWKDRMEFKADGDSVHREILVSDIKAQFVNPSTSAKALLRITLFSSAEPEQFQFMGKQPHAERDQFKDTLAECINAFRTGQEPPSQPSQPASASAQASHPISAEQIKARQALLQRDIKLARLHKELVRGGMLTEEDFWEPRRHLLESQIMENGQAVGLPTEITHDIRPTSTEGADIKYTLTPQDIKSIFLHYPSLKRAYDENVPNVLNEKEFWTRCFQSSFFYRDRMGRTKKDAIFDKAAAEEEQELQKSAAGEVKNFLLDLTEDDKADDEFHPELDNTAKFAKASQSLPLIRRFNRHGDLIVKTFQPQQSQETPRHKQILREVLKIEDLEPQVEQQPIMLNVKPDGGYVGNLDSLLSNDGMISNQEDENVKLFCNQLRNTLDIKSLPQINAKKNYDLLQKLVETNENRQKQTVESSSSVNPELLHIHTTAVEILKHFWSCHTLLLTGQATAAAGEEDIIHKRKRMRKALKNVQEKVKNAQSPLFASLNTALETAFNFQPPLTMEK